MNPIIIDEYVDREFGTGALKITPAHDINDYEIGIRHGLESIDIFNANGSLNEAAQLYVGQDRFEVRPLIVEDLTKAGNVVKIEDENGERTIRKVDNDDVLLISDEPVDDLTLSDKVY